MESKEIVGQEDLRAKLRSMVWEDRYPHALMLSGRLGYGGMPIAIELARYLMCRERSAEGSCGHCDQCLKNTDLQNPDLMLSFPTISQGGPTTSDDFYPEYLDFILQRPYGDISQWLAVLDAEKKQPNISAKECRRIIDRLSLKSVSSEAKVLIMWLPEYLGKEGNILLKQIEEPSPETFMIFVVENESQVLGTIRSRVQSVSVPPIAAEDLEKATADRLPLLYAKSHDFRSFGGDWNRVLQAAEPEDSNYVAMIRQFLNAAFTNSIDHQIEWVSSMETLSRHDQDIFLQSLMDTLYGVLRSDQPTEDPVISKLRNFDLSLAQIQLWVDIIEDVKYSIKRNVQAKLSFYNLVLRTQLMLKNYEISNQ